MKECYHCGGPSADQLSVCPWCGTAFSPREVPVVVRDSASYEGPLTMECTLSGDRWKLDLSAGITVAIAHANSDLARLNPLNAAEHDARILERAREMACERVRSFLNGLGDDPVAAQAPSPEALRLYLADRLESLLSADSLMRNINEDISGLGARLSGPPRLFRDRFRVSENLPTQPAVCPSCGKVTPIPLSQRTYVCPQCASALTFCKHCKRFVTSDRQERICDFCRFHL